jgi:hypothetical protein
MRKQRSRSAGLGRGIVLTALALAVLVGAGLWPAAEATTSRAQQLDALLRAPGGESRKAQAIEELRKLDSTTARDELKDLADCTDDRVAMLAIRTLGRANFTGAKTKIAGVYEDETRSDVVRAMALIAWCQLQANAGKSWADGKAWVKSHAGENAMLCEQYAASKAKLWANEVDSE